MDQQESQGGFQPMAIAELERPDIRLQGIFRRDRDPQTQILSQFDPEQQRLIRHRQQILSSLAYFIGKDFKIPVRLGLPSEQNPSGWEYGVDTRNLSDRYIQMNAHDLATLPMERLRFRTCHEAGHARITTHAEVVSMDDWNQPGFSYLMNCIEDPRANNFVTEAYPRIRSDMVAEYQSLREEEEQAASQKAQEELGYKPKFMQAGFEYIKQWFREVKGEAQELPQDLPDDVRAVVETTLESAKDSCLRYPSKQEADKGSTLINRYAQVSYEINRDEIWPEFRKLVEEDLKDQQTQEALKDMQQSQQGEGGEGSGEGALSPSQGLKSTLNEQEQQELEAAIDKAMQQAQSDQPTDGQPQPGGEQTAGAGKPVIIDLDSLSPFLKQKIKDYIDSLPEDVKKELAKRAQAALAEFEEGLNEALEGKLTDNPKKKAERAKQKALDEAATTVPAMPPSSNDEDQSEIEAREAFQRKQFQESVEKVLHKDDGPYEEARAEVLPIIDELEAELREIFIQRRAHRWKSGYKSGKRVDIKKRIQEKAKEVPVVESKAWQRPEQPQEKDYAATLLVDLSGSMQGEKIDQTFKAAVVLAEVLNRLSIKTEILGFNDRLYEYQRFGEDMSQEVRAKMGTMPKEVYDSSDTGKARWNDDGWAVEQASERLARQIESEKFLLVLSDGEPIESPMHPAKDYDLKKIVQRIMRESPQKLIGLGIGPGTGHVENYYPNSVANIRVNQLPAVLSKVILEAIENYDSF